MLSTESEGVPRMASIIKEVSWLTRVLRRRRSRNGEKSRKGQRTGTCAEGTEREEFDLIILFSLAIIFFNKKKMKETQ